ncbi:MAG TPA: YndJ family transporter [Acidimicrobiales bacterium]|nr:YndJ family transporter [Acidimicrobiales bacterium]
MLLAGGPVVVAGLGLAVAAGVLGDGIPPALVVARRVQPAGAVAAVVALLLPEGAVAGALATLWLGVCVCAAVGGLSLVGRVASGDALDVELVRWPLALVTLAVSTMFLTVGGTWLVISRSGLRPFDLSTDIVRLTAVHFHYAGFGMALLAATGLACADWMASRVSLSIGSVAAVVGPPIVAVGFVTGSGPAQVGGALVVTVAAWAVAFGTFLLATSSSASPAAPARWRGAAQWCGRSLLIVSALSPLVPMVLAVQWALAQHVAIPALSISDMANTHGVLNGLGFVTAGLAGWLLAGVSSPETDPTLAATA